MGIDIHGLNFLKYIRNFGSIGDVITVGRQGVHIDERVFVEGLGAASVTALDHTGHQPAGMVHDMNLPLAAEHHGRFDTVIDGGTLAQVFNLPQALLNCSLLCRPGGQIVHILPANNACGHGFWQFSPELFFCLYSAANGYDRTEVYLADATDPATWYKVRPPSSGLRANIVSTNEVHALVRTVRGETIRRESVRRSDHVHEWTLGTERQVAPRASILQRALSPFPALRRFNRESRLGPNNPALTPCRVDALI